MQTQQCQEIGVKRSSWSKMKELFQPSSHQIQHCHNKINVLEFSFKLFLSCPQLLHHIVLEKPNLNVSSNVKLYKLHYVNI